MTSVTAKKLRDNLSDYLDRLQAGEEIAIIRHSEIIGSLKPAKNYQSANGTSIADMLARNQSFFRANKSLTDPQISTTELYGQALDKDYR